MVLMHSWDVAGVGFTYNSLDPREEKNSFYKVMQHGQCVST